ncbi:hypothetical protein [Rhodococcus opacus]|uniref:hypothetical protein n=1 Tax=Rhodococcus opacus TaxID=37919 RepID=UPI001C478E76|nr:hypothetical protein [Rhodococcus opacus]MBV6758341.1 hypothetical protein [Rhodococcus opacus]
MSDIGLRLLRLQQEFANRGDLVGMAKEFHRPDYGPRSEEEIAADYEEALRELLS